MGKKMGLKRAELMVSVRENGVNVRLNIVVVVTVAACLLLSTVAAVDLCGLAYSPSHCLASNLVPSHQCSFFAFLQTPFLRSFCASLRTLH